MLDFITSYAFLKPGDLLVFMPGQEDIEVTCALIRGTIFMDRVKCWWLLKLMGAIVPPPPMRHDI